MDYQIKLDSFEGPFDLLLHLIDKNEVDIYDIPIAVIAEQYLDYIKAMEAIDLNIASEFLVMAATLLSIKAKMLLPKPPPELLDEDEDYDPRSKLVQDLLEYKRIKLAATCLDEFYHSRQLEFERNNDESLYSNLFKEANPLEGKTLIDLASAFHTVWQKLKSEHTIHSIQRDQITIGRMAEQIVQRLHASPQGVLFTEILESATSRIHVVVAFIAILELIKVAAIKVQQDCAYGKIYMLPLDLSRHEYV